VSWFVQSEESVSAVDHVEGYAPEPTDEYSLYCYDTHRDLTPSEYREKVVTNGEYQRRELTGENFASSKGYRRLIKVTSKVGRPIMSSQVNEPGPLPYDYRLDQQSSFIQLIVGNQASTDARDLLSSFDLNICKAHFDGTYFRIPSPHKTFESQTSCIGARKAVVEAWLQTEFNVGEAAAQTGDGTYNIGDVIRGMPPAVWKRIGMDPYDQAIYDKELLQSERWCKTNMWDGLAHRDLTLLNTKPPPETMRWETYYACVQRLIERLQKYSRRGVQILDAPVDAIDYKIHYMEGR
jgi:hypothetical protein